VPLVEGEVGVDDLLAVQPGEVEADECARLRCSAVEGARLQFVGGRLAARDARLDKGVVVDVTRHGRVDRDGVDALGILQPREVWGERELVAGPLANEFHLDVLAECHLPRPLVRAGVRHRGVRHPQLWQPARVQERDGAVLLDPRTEPVKRDLEAEDHRLPRRLVKDDQFLQRVDLRLVDQVDAGAHVRVRDPIAFHEPERSKRTHVLETEGDRALIGPDARYLLRGREPREAQLERTASVAPRVPIGARHREPWIYLRPDAVGSPIVNRSRGNPCGQRPVRVAKDLRELRS
jgi:hypothetical protein